MPRKIVTDGEDGGSVEVALEQVAAEAEALSVVAEWRRALRAVKNPLHILAWLGATQRLLRLKIQLIDDRRLTLPPDTAPWDDVRRDNELHLREHRLRELGRQRLWTEPLPWAGRVVTLGRFGGEEGRRTGARDEARVRGTTR